MTNNSHFRRSRPTYTCNCCQRLTRETGLGEAGCDLCAFCYEAAGEYNRYQDGDIDRAKLDAILADLEKGYGKLAHKGCCD